MPVVRIVLSLIMIVMCGTSGFVMAEVVVREETVGADQRVVLENRYVRAAFSPSRGGQCTELVYKPVGKDFVSGGGALLGSRVWNFADDNAFSQWERRPWDYTLERRPGEAGVTLAAVGEADFRACRFEKRVMLREEEAMLRVDHSFHVGAQLMTPQTVGLWFGNSVGVAGERLTCCFPMEEGIVTRDSDRGSKENWFYTPARGWMACVGESGLGLSFNMEYKWLMGFHMRSGPQPVCGWAFRTLDITNGDTFSTEEFIVPFQGIRRVHGSANGVVAGFDAPDRVTSDQAGGGLSFKALLAVGCPQKGTLRITLQPLPTGEATRVAEIPVDLKPGEVATVPFTLNVVHTGAWLLSGALLRDGAVIMDFIKPLTIGNAATVVRIQPQEQRLGDGKERFDDRKRKVDESASDLPYTMAIETPHVKWAKPLAGGKLRVLVLTCCFNGREAAELAQRLDMEIVWATAGKRRHLGRIGNLFGSRKSGDGYRPEKMNQNILNALKEPLDAVIIGGLPGSEFSEDVLAALEKKVSGGTGLVYVSPSGLDGSVADKNLPKEPDLSDGQESELLEGLDLEPCKGRDFLPVMNGRPTGLSGRKSGQWKASERHFITGGVPFESLPRTGYGLYEPTGTVIAMIDKSPLIITQEGPGKGRVVVFTYNCGDVSGVTPWIEDRETGVPYWEYDLVMLAKALVWSARREPDVRLMESVGRIIDGRPEIAVDFQNVGKAVELMAEITLHDAYGKVEWQTRQSVTIQPGQTHLSLPLPPETGGGLHLADMIFRDAQGNSIAWGTASVTIGGAIVFNSVTVDKRAYSAGDTINTTCKLRPVDGAAGEVLLTATLTDDLDRLLERCERQVPVQGETNLVFQFKLGEPLTTVATIRIGADFGGRQAAVVEQKIIMLPRRFAERSWGDDWPVAVWGSGCGSYGAGGRDYLAAGFARRLKDLGVRVCTAPANNLTERWYEDQVRLGFQVMPMGVGFGFISVGKEYKHQKAQYRKTFDKKYLVRPICLNDHKQLEPLAEKLRKLAEYTAELGIIGYNLGDEMSLTDHKDNFDYDFGPVCIDAFRAWLKTQYSSLDELNQQWNTDFQAWDAVMPMTAHEVKNRGNYAPWADHRAFMDVTFANFFKWTRDRLRQEDGKSMIGMSGTQAARVYSGYNWSLLGAELDFAQTYTVEDTAVMHRSLCHNMPCLTWFGYAHRNPNIRSWLWGLLFEGNQGCSYWATEMIFNPDLTFGFTAADMAPVIRELESGAARLLKNCRRVTLVGMHYSQASMRGGHIVNVLQDSQISKNRCAWGSALSESGYEFLDSAEIEAGELLKRKYSAFVLPYSIAVSDKEAAELRRYVESGGLLIADGRIGLMDEHCTSRGQAVLDELFGVTRPAVSPLTPLRAGTVKCTEDLKACRLKGFSFDASVADPDLKLAGGQALGTSDGVPIFIVHKQGKGMTLLANLFLGDKLESETRKRLVGNILALGGIRPLVTVQAEGDPAPSVTPRCFRNGDGLIVGTVLNPDGHGMEWSAKVNITFPEEGYIYDLREGKLVGHGQFVEKRLFAGDAALYAVMPYRVKKVVVNTDRSEFHGGESVRYDIKTETDKECRGAGVFRVEVIGPDGSVRTHYGMNLTATNGVAAGTVFTALSDAPGIWTIKATDYLSSVAGIARFEVVK